MEPRKRRSRKSIATQPNTARNKEGDGPAPEAPAKNMRKSRSKSLGPGGLSALNAEGENGKSGILKSGNGNGRRASLAPASQVKSILKPTLPLSPLKEIPAHRPRTALRGVPSQNKESVTLPNSIFQPPPPQPAQPTTVPVRTEEEQQRRAEILAARAARRQSLGNRRVSFAPEATLHTWDVVEYERGDDGSSTPGGSSNAGSSRSSTPASNRRSSNGSSGDTPTPAESPSTPLRQKNRHETRSPPMNLNNPDEYFSSSPCSSPAGTEKSFVEMEASGSDSDSMDDHDTISDKTFMTESGETTMGDGEPMRMDMDIDDDDTTAAFRQPIFKKPPQWRLEDGETAAMPSSPPVLQPDTPAPVDLGEEGEMTMEDTELVNGLLQTVEAKKPTPFSFSPKTPQKANDDEMAMEMPGPLGSLLLPNVLIPQTHQGQDDEDDAMEMTRPVGGILRPLKGRSPKKEDNVAEVDMDMTRPIGGIMNASKSRMSLGFSQYQDDDADLPMDITRPVGGIISVPGPQVISPAHSAISDSNENMTMEFTSVLGGIISQAPKNAAGRAGKLISGDDWAIDQADKQKQNSRKDVHVDDDKERHIPIDPFAVRQPSSPKEEQMDMVTPSAGKLDVPATVAYPALPVPEEKDEGQDMDVDMEMTVNVGCILQSRPLGVAEKQEPSPEIVTPNQTTENVQSVSPSTESKNSGDITPAQVASPTPRAKRNTRRSSGATRTARLTRAQRKSLEADQGSTPQPSSTPGKIPTPKKASSPKSGVPTPTKTETPTKAQPAPIPQQPTPQKAGTPQLSTPPERVTPMVPTMKPTTPSKQTPKLQTPVRPRSIGSGFSVEKGIAFRRSPSPVKNQSAPMRTPLRGMGINRIGLGSPTINQRLSVRKSLVEDTMAFSPIAIPSALLQATCDDREKHEQEEHEEKARREEEHKKMDLKSRISLLTPRKAGRQSLAIGTLVPGKRALESPGESSKKRRKSVDGGDTIVDEIDEEACERLRASLRSGYTSGMLPIPVSAKKTPKTPKTGSSPRTTPAATPVRVAVSFGKDDQMGDQMGDQEQTEETFSREEKEEENESMVDEDEVRISFPEFLDLIGISFLDDLQATSGRRHASSASSSQRPSLGVDGGEEASLAERIAAAASTAPMLELYQHSCRELKQYIQGGRDCVKEIESKAYADNPPLFKEYLYSPPDIRAIMDTQFKNIKTHARLQAKGIWYEWRQKLLEGVLTALRQNLKGLQEDQEVIKKQDEIIAQMLPDIEKEHEEAKDKLEKIEKLEKRIAMDDPEELEEARSQLREVLDKTAAVREQVLRKRQDVEALNSEIEIKEKKKAELVASIEEAERIKEMNRGWSEEEVKTWKTRCENLERESGWCITGALPDSRLEMMFMREIKLICDPNGNTAPWVEYHYSLSGKPSERKPMPKVEREFFVSNLNTILAHERDPKVVLKVVSNFWGNALGVVDSISQLRKQHYIEIRATDDEDLKVKATVLVQELRSKMEIGFVVGKETPQVKHAGVRVVYGAISQQAVQDMLMQWTGEWRDGVNEAVERCLEDRRRGGVVIGVKG